MAAHRDTADEEPRRGPEPQQPNFARGQSGEEGVPNVSDFARGQRRDETKRHEGDFAEGAEHAGPAGAETDDGDYARGERQGPHPG